MTVKYQGQTYKVLSSNYIGNYRLYKLRSNFSGGAPFAALKSECE